MPHSGWYVDESGVDNVPEFEGKGEKVVWMLSSLLCGFFAF
jgi:hypothetical protein